MKENSFNKIKIFSGSNAQSLVEKVNKFLQEHYGKIKVVKRSMNSITWGESDDWYAEIQIILCYKEQSVTYGERVVVVSYEEADGSKTEKRLNDQMSSDGIEVIDLLSTSYIGHWEQSQANSFIALFLKS